jgi:hypothetical protein
MASTLSLSVSSFFSRRSFTFSLRSSASCRSRLLATVWAIWGSTGPTCGRPRGTRRWKAAPPAAAEVEEEVEVDGAGRCSTPARLSSNRLVNCGVWRGE